MIMETVTAFGRVGLQPILNQVGLSGPLGGLRAAFERTNIWQICDITCIKYNRNGVTSKRSYSSIQRPKYNPQPNPEEVPSGGFTWNYLYFLLPVTCFGLGYWQVKRLDWKNELIEGRQEGLKAPPVPLDLTADPMTLPKELSWKPVTVSGIWVHGKEILMGPRVYNGVNGSHLITPLETDSGDRVLVNRGFVPKDKQDPYSRPESLTKGKVSVTGTLRVIQSKPNWVPENNPERKGWYWVDIPTLAAETDSQPFFLEQLLDTNNPTTLPIGGQLHQPLTNNHFQYALTWTSLGFILTGMSYLLVKRAQMGPRPPYINYPLKKPFKYQPSPNSNNNKKDL